jgi:PAS domain S-box-containing protein
MYRTGFECPEGILLRDTGSFGATVWGQAAVPQRSGQQSLASPDRRGSGVARVGLLPRPPIRGHRNPDPGEPYPRIHFGKVFRSVSRFTPQSFYESPVIASPVWPGHSDSGYGRLSRRDSAEKRSKVESTVLVVNDAPDSLELMRLQLSRAGYRVLTAFDGQEGYEVARRERPRLVVSDVSMPRVDGIELCRLMRGHASLRDTPALLVSAIRKDSKSVVEGLKAGADDYLEAPYDPALLLAKVAQLIKREETEDALRESQARLAGIVESAMDAIITVDGGQRILFFNRAAEQMFRCTAADALGRPLDRFIPGRFRAAHAAHVRALRADGEEFPVEASISQVEAGGQKLYTVILRDITERKQAEDDLRRQKEILQKIFDHIPVMVSFFDADGRLTLVNREWERTVGWTLEEVRQQNLDIFAECYPDPEERRKVRDFLATPNDHWADFYTKVRDGRVIETTWAVVRLSDGTSISIGQDITERKRVEERLRKSNEELRALAARLQAVREEESIKIAREIHDELGGGLTGLKMDVSWIERRLPGDGDEAVRQKLRSMSELIDETIQKVRNISTELRPSVLDDLGLAAAIEWQAREFQRRTEIECVITSLDEEVALSAEKSTAVFRIFQEVLTNVARHARATRVEISMEKRDGDLVLKVCDDGRGIRESDISDTRSLGLLGMRERAVVFGGVVEIEGGSGRGTTVTVSIPRE